MPKMINEIGNQYEYLTVLERDKTQKGVKWLCQCKCGNTVSVRGTDLRAGKVKSCGCYKSEQTSKRSIKDLTNQRFGKLTVLYRVGSNARQSSIWHCRCDCGKEKDILGTSLVAGLTQSCGCLRSETTTQKNLKKSDIKIGQAYNYLIPIKFLGLKYATENSQKQRSYYLCKCKLCGNEIEVTSNSLISGATKSCGCCNVSYGELQIENFLKNNNIQYIKEYKFNDLIDKRCLRFDFAILNDKKELLFLLEYDGKQHFLEGCTGRFEGKYEEIHQHDLLKNNYCLTNNIKLVRINYKEKLEERLEEIFHEYL